MLLVTLDFPELKIGDAILCFGIKNSSNALFLYYYSLLSYIVII